MNGIIRVLLFVTIAAVSLSVQADSASLLGQAQAANAARYQFATSNNAEIRNTSDNKAFTIWWQPGSSTPAGVIVTLHGHDSYATDEFYLWQPYAQSRGYAILALQWWFGGGETVADYYQPQEMYPIIAQLLTEKGVQPGAVLLHGYSRGSANSYAMTALDAASGNRFISMTLSNSGGAAADFPPNQQIVAGAFGLKPFSGVQWVMYCGELDPDPAASGCPGMSAAKDWVTKYGATFKLLIDDPVGGHGGFMTNSANVDTALAQFAPTTLTRLNLVTGWNLLGNSGNAPLEVAPTLADAGKVTTAWKWLPASSKWAFYAPSMTGQGLSDYAVSKGYEVLATINAGEGFWVNAKTPFSVSLPNAAAVLASSFNSTLLPGWSLISIGETKSPGGFNALLGTTASATGTDPLNVTTLWAWDSGQSLWYFYAPSLNNSGGLAAYIRSKGYLDFTLASKTLGPGVGFWVNRPDTTTTTAAAITATSVIASRAISQGVWK